MNRRLMLCTLFLATAAPAQLLPGWVIGSWWKQGRIVDKLGLTPDQQKKIDDVFQQSRVKLIDLTASLDREEAIMEQLMKAEPPDSARIRPEIDRVAQARFELEKANANMLLGMRLVLTKEQWEMLRDNTVRPGPGRGGPLPRKVR
jgi:protein CpxP